MQTLASMGEAIIMVVVVLDNQQMRLTTQVLLVLNKVKIIRAKECAMLGVP